MKLFVRIISTLLVLAAFCFADTAQGPTSIKKAVTGDSAVATVDTGKLAVDSGALDSIGRAASATEAAIQKQAKKHAVWIKLEGDVEPSMYEFCARAIDDALQENPDYIVFEINTFGGRLDAAFDLVDTIMAVKGPTTIALVKKKAISAGSLIALA